MSTSVDLAVLIARFLHVVLGVFWGGTVILNAFFLAPALRDAGPDGAKVIAALMRRRMMDALPLAALLTILSGTWLLWRVSGGFNAEYLRSAQGLAYGLGGIASIIALIAGSLMIRPSMLKAAALSQAAAQATPADRDAKLAQAKALRDRATTATNIVSVLVVGTIIAMALARYL